jgi:phage shock protein PspC (stress-responsive transcriptional regulator)
MKKIININFHSRVVPIEETAYEILQQYIESLRRYFANEEGREEIISDIENRFAELFSESLKKGTTCITDADVNTIITSMGRPEELEEEERAGATNAGTGSYGTGMPGDGTTRAGTGQQANSSQQGPNQFTADEPRRLYRAGNDKILGGVCAGLANYLRLDPAIVRIIFVLITFGWGAGVLLYIILWIALPTRSLTVNTRKRLYRNSDDRVIAGVASGLAAYFHIEVWIPRLIFALPLIVGVITSILRSAWFDFDGPVFFTGGFGGTLFITYIVLWIVLPEAVTASEKLEMRGEKVDLESIKNTIKNDLENFNKRAKDMGTEVKESFVKASEQVKQSTQSFTTEVYPVVRKTGSGIGHAIGVLFKAFFLFIAGLIAFVLIMVLAGLAFRGNGALNLKGFILEGVGQNFLAWASFILFLVIPVVALLTWLIRRITGFRSRNHYLGYIFASLWVIGLFCFITLAFMVISNFRSRQHVEENTTLSQPTDGKLTIKAIAGKDMYYDNDWWFDADWGKNGPFYSVDDDSLIMKTIRVRILKSEDSNYHVQVLKFSHGSNSRIARGLAEQIVFPVQQADNILYLPHGFAVTREQKFRNQQVLIEVSVPIGKKIIVNSNIDDYQWFTIHVNNRHIRWNNHRDEDWNFEEDDDSNWGNSFQWSSNTEYIMTTDGLSRTDKKNPEPEEGEKQKMKTDDKRNEEKKSEEKKNGEQPDTDKGGYRYKGPAEPAKPKNSRDSAAPKSTALQQDPEESPVYLLSALFTQ